MKYLILTLLLLPLITEAQEFVPLVGVPGVDPNGGGGIGEYVQALYILAISVAAFLAVVKIIFSGVQYLLSDVVTSKEDAKRGIRGALLGLLIVLAAVIILETINPQLTNLDVFSAATIPVEMGSGGVFDLFGSGFSGTNGGAQSITSQPVTITDDNQAAVNALMLQCAQENGNFTISTNANGDQVANCDTTTAVEQTTGNDEAALQAQRDSCNNIGRVYTETTLGNGATQVTCGASCEFGVAPGTNSCAASNQTGGNISFQCDSSSVEYASCANYCVDQGGSFVNNTCTGAATSFYD